MTTPDVFHGLPCHWQGVDSTTPDGCTLFVTTVVGLVTTYILRGGQVIGRIEIHEGKQVGYVGQQLKGGVLVGLGDSAGLAEKIVDRASKEN